MTAPQLTPFYIKQQYQHPTRPFSLIHMILFSIASCTLIKNVGTLWTPRPIGPLWREPLLKRYGPHLGLTADWVGPRSRISQHKTNKASVGCAGWTHICLGAIHLQADSPHSLKDKTQVKTQWWRDMQASQVRVEHCWHKQAALCNLNAIIRSPFPKVIPLSLKPNTSTPFPDSVFSPIAS